MSFSFEIQAAIIIKDSKAILTDQSFEDCPYWVALFKLCRDGEKLVWRGSSLILDGGGYRTRKNAEAVFIAEQFDNIPLLKKTFYRNTKNFSLTNIILPYEEYPL